MIWPSDPTSIPDEPMMNSHTPAVLSDSNRKKIEPTTNATFPMIPNRVWNHS